MPHGLRPERPKFSDGTDVPDALWSTITLCWHAEPSHRPSTPALVEATRSLITTARPLTPPPDFLEPTEEKVTLDIVTAGEDPLLGERTIDPTVHPWAGDRHDWQEYLLEKTMTSPSRHEEKTQQWSRTQSWQVDPLI